MKFALFLPLLSSLLVFASQTGPATERDISITSRDLGEVRYPETAGGYRARRGGAETNGDLLRRWVFTFSLVQTSSYVLTKRSVVKSSISLVSYMNQKPRVSKTFSPLSRAFCLGSSWLNQLSTKSESAIALHLRQLHQRSVKHLQATYINIEDVSAVIS